MSVQELMSRRDAFNATLAAVDSLEQEIISIHEEAAARVLEMRDRIKSLISAQSVSPVAMSLPAAVAMPVAVTVSLRLWLWRVAAAGVGVSTATASWALAAPLVPHRRSPQMWWA